MATSKTPTTPPRRAARRPATPPPLAVAQPAVAAGVAVEENVTVLTIPKIGQVSLPPLDHLAWYAGVGVLTAVELIEWPVALAVTIGKMLADSRTHRTLRSFGEALEVAD